MTETGADGPVAIGRSGFHLRDAAFTAVVGLVLAVVQGAVRLLGATDGWFLPFGPVAIAALVIAVPLAARGVAAERCRACGIGLHDDLSLAVDEVGWAALQAPSLTAGVVGATAAAHPGSIRLPLAWCPRCRAVAVLRVPERAELVGPEVQSVLDVAEVELG